jgi:hypothetical protein
MKPTPSEKLSTLYLDLAELMAIWTIALIGWPL